MKKLLLANLFFIFFSTSLFANHPGGTVYADVNGLVCDFCARAIDKMFRKQEAVESIDVNLDNKLITIHFREGKKLEEKTIVEMIKDSGYDVEKIRYEN